MKKLLFLAAVVTVSSCQPKRLLIDTHNDALSSPELSRVDMGQRQTVGNFDLVRAKKGGLSGQVFSIWCGESFSKGGGFAHANKEIDSLYSLISRHPDKITLCRTAEDVKQAYAQGKFAALIGVEGGHMIEERMENLDALAKRGMRYLTLTWNNSPSWATSARDETVKGDSLAHKGLTDFGKKIVHHMNDLGVMVDVSHVGEATFYDVLATTSKPVIASHSSVYALTPNRRNLKDDQLKALAKNGGVAFVNFYSGFIDSAYERKEGMFIRSHRAQLDSLRSIHGHDYSADLLNSVYPQEADAIRPPLSALINHIDYMVKLIGVDHVGIGSDFDGSESYPKGLDSVEDYPKVTKELKKLGYSKDDIDKIFGLNFLRVLKANAGK
ncbi:MAG: rane dipeptidase [Sphingobacteriaceae bacterium]|jgi:membrane dipeptidase|nr:rane dipeptidase [Sphingobacteriaceae bacterium]